LIQRLALALLLTSVGGLLPVRASDDLYVRYFGGVADGKPCYAQYYNDAHLKAHPKQTVRRIEIDFDASWREDEGGKNTGSDFQAGIAPAFVAYWTNNGQTAALGLDLSAAIDPKRTSDLRRLRSYILI